jgi:hypothetical protein
MTAQGRGIRKTTQLAITEYYSKVFYLDDRRREKG